MADIALVWHLICPYHGDLGDFATEADAQTAIGAHLTAMHTDGEGTVAPDAAVLLFQAKAVTAADL